MIIRFEEFRFTCSPFASTSERRLRVMLNRIARGYQGLAGKNIGLENTNVLLVSVINIDDDRIVNKELYYCQGKKNDYIGGFNFFISETKLLASNDAEKRLYAFEEFHIAFIYFLKHFNYNEEVALFEKAKERMINEHDFWCRYTKGYISRNKKYECWLEDKECWGFAEHRLVFKNLTTEKINYLFIDNKAYPFFDEMTNITKENHWDIVLNTPQFFEKMKWVKNTFEFYWGKEKYVFNAEKEEIICNILE